MANRNSLVVKLKSGEYDGADIMQAWLLIEELEATIKRVEALPTYEVHAGKNLRKACGAYVLKSDVDKALNKQEGES